MHSFPYLHVLIAALASFVHVSVLAERSFDEDILRSVQAASSSLDDGLKGFLGTYETVIFQNVLRDKKTNQTICPGMSVIFARGTAEPGNVGILTGPPFFAAIGEYMNGTNQLAIQGVDYEAQPAGFFAGGSVRGAATITLTSCPNTPLLVSGYSQGAQLIHLATASLPNSTTSRITSVVMFGDPKNGTALNGVDARRVITICHAGDDICAGGARVTKDHLNYSLDARRAAIFALGSIAKLGITSKKMVDLGRAIG
ncbi:hypothetical protein B2J93_7466 [Marssonina coronariae]|uniref:cutinase n=1 Tax=Diplocarpon coronariae TaxID=2795749 RepID=A0A218Z624_9HELO|nr:hypothetical protein B2J93_7466 [Marssonina coronariae]